VGGGMDILIEEKRYSDFNFKFFSQTKEMRYIFVIFILIFEVHSFCLGLPL
jgi:ERCC4-type nuclease